MAQVFLGLVVGMALGYWGGRSESRVANQAGFSPSAQAAEQSAVAPKSSNGSPASLHLYQSPAAIAKDRQESDYGLGDSYYKNLKPYPPGGPGDRTPLDLWHYAGRGDNSWGSPVLPVSWDKWVEMCKERKPKLMADVRSFMEGRFAFTGAVLAGARMSGGKPIMKGPVARLPKGVASYEDLAKLSADEIKKRDVFPFKPLAHPLQTTAHMLFPAQWTRAHPEHERMDVDFDMPEEYLPEFPPPMFLTTHKELGDVARGQEVTLGNYYEIFNGLLTPEQMEGLKELLRPSPTTWFNQTTHRVTVEPSARALASHVSRVTSTAMLTAPLSSRRTPGPIKRGCVWTPPV